MTPEELVDQLARELFATIDQPRRTVWEELGDPVQDRYREGAVAAIHWLHDHTDPVDVSRDQVTLDELLQ